MIKALSTEIERLDLKQQPVSVLCDFIVKEADLWKTINDSKKEIAVFENKFE
jgi:hypothetical protein